jgi:hypothetical protein
VIVRGEDVASVEAGLHDAAAWPRGQGRVDRPLAIIVGEGGVRGSIQHREGGEVRSEHLQLVAADSKQLTTICAADARKARCVVRKR